MVQSSAGCPGLSEVSFRLSRCGNQHGLHRTGQRRDDSPGKRVDRRLNRRHLGQPSGGHSEVNRNAILDGYKRGLKPATTYCDNVSAKPVVAGLSLRSHRRDMATSDCRFYDNPRERRPTCRNGCMIQERRVTTQGTKRDSLRQGVKTVGSEVL